MSPALADQVQLPFASNASHLLRARPTQTHVQVVFRRDSRGLHASAAPSSCLKLTRLEGDILLWQGFFLPPLPLSRIKTPTLTLRTRCWGDWEVWAGWPQVHAQSEGAEAAWASRDRSGTRGGPVSAARQPRAERFSKRLVRMPFLNSACKARGGLAHHLHPPSPAFSAPALGYCGSRPTSARVGSTCRHP